MNFVFRRGTPNQTWRVATCCELSDADIEMWFNVCNIFMRDSFVMEENNSLNGKKTNPCVTFLLEINRSKWHKIVRFVHTTFHILRFNTIKCPFLEKMTAMLIMWKYIIDSREIFLNYNENQCIDFKCKIWIQNIVH